MNELFRDALWLGCGLFSHVSTEIMYVYMCVRMYVILHICKLPFKFCDHFENVSNILLLCRLIVGQVPLVLKYCNKDE